MLRVHVFAASLCLACGTGEAKKVATNAVEPVAPQTKQSAPKTENNTEPTSIPDTPPEPQRPALFDPDRSTSLGGPSGGALRGGVALPESAPGFQLNPKRPNPDGNYATAELANALLQSAFDVARKYPESTLVVGDLSLETGGPIYHHGSHQSGRDVDVLFFYQTHENQPFASKGIPIEPDGSGDDYMDLRDSSDDIAVKLDVPRTWAFVEAFVTQPDVRVARIFVVEHVRQLLLDYARANGGDAQAIETFAQTTCQPAVPHDDHFHIRLFCSVQDIAEGCKDAHPIYPWQRSFLREQGTEPQIALRTRKQKKDTKKRTVSQAQAAQTAGPLAPEVRAFLERRKNWSKLPHPGRAYCK